MQIILYNSSAEKNKLDKTSQLGSAVTLNGTLRNECSVTNPEIEVQSTGYISSNYAYIPEFNRYYFIDGITSVRNGLWRLSMTVDVLMSFKTEILSLQNAKISRSGINGFNQRYRISDSNLPMGDEFKFTVLDSEDSGFSNLDGACSWYIITATQQEDTVPTVSGSSASIQYKQANARLTPVSSAVRIYIYGNNANFMKDLLNIAKDDTINQYLIEAGCVPFNYATALTPTSYTAVTEIECGTKKVAAHAANSLNYNAQMINTSFVLNGAIDIDKAFLDSTKYYIFLPFYGELELPKHCIFTSASGAYTIQCFIKMCIDFTNMSITYFVLGENTDVILTQSVSIGVKIPLDRSNLEEVKRNETANMLNLLGSLVSAGALGVASAVTLNPFGLVTAAGSAVAAGIGYTARDKTNVEKGSAVFSSNSNLSLLSSPNAFKLYEICHYTEASITAMYHNQYGYAYDIVGNIANCNGFTVIDDVHVESISTALSDEIDKISEELKRGVII